jgi:hypothetical protein
MGRVWALLTYRRRAVPAGALVHDSVRARIEKDPAYGARVPRDAVWEDQQWLTPTV